MNNILVIGLLLALKHFIADGPMQTAYQYLNKGKPLHPGGILHAAIHGVFTTAICAPLGYAWIGAVDAFVHYVIDLTKVRVTKSYGWSEMVMPSGRLSLTEAHRPPFLAIYSNWYFYALILDQCLHFATYVWILSVVATP